MLLPAPSLCPHDSSSLGGSSSLSKSGCQSSSLMLTTCKSPWNVRGGCRACEGCKLRQGRELESCPQWHCRECLRARRFRASLLLRTTCNRSCCNVRQLCGDKTIKKKPQEIWIHTHSQKDKQKSNTTQHHQEITRVILCRLILNDIIVHVKFFNDIILFYKIV